MAGRPRDLTKRNHNPKYAKDDPRNPFRIGQLGPDGKVICGAKSRGRARAGDPDPRCLLSPMENGRCRFHGGKIPRGVLAPTFKTGRYSKYMPENLIDKYEESLEDPRLIELRDEIAMIDARIKTCIQRTERGESQDFWLTLDEMWKEFVAAIRRGDSVKQTEMIGPISQVITTKASSERGWNDISRLTETRRKLVETEQKRLQLAGQFVQVERVITMMSSMIIAIKEIAYAHTEPATARKIVASAGERYKQLINYGETTPSNGSAVDE